MISTKGDFTTAPPTNKNFEIPSRNDFEYLKYDFRSFTNEISKWQIAVDDRLSSVEDLLSDVEDLLSDHEVRLSEAENQIQGTVWYKIMM